jgi:hypothetical protein
VKNKSGSPSKSKSATETPPPLKIYSSVRILKESDSIISLLKSIPVSSGDFNTKSVSSFLQDPSRIKKRKEMKEILGFIGN